MNNFKNKLTSDWPLNELIKGNWNDKYAFDQNAPLYFKFNDNQKLIKNLQNKLKSNSTFHHIFDNQISFKNELKTIRIWLKNDDNIIEMNILDVYTGLIKHLRDQSFEDQLFNSNEVSFIGPLGPFKHMPLIECLNDELIDKLIFSQVLQNKLPTRKMRIHTQDHIRMEYGDKFDKIENIEIRQITDSGILFSSTNDIILNQINNSEFVKVFIDTTAIKKFTDNDLTQVEEQKSPFFYTENELRYFFIEEKNILKSLSYKSGFNNEVFLFCRYLHMLESDVPNVFHDFTQKVNDYFKKIA